MRVNLGVCGALLFCVVVFLLYGEQVQAQEKAEDYPWTAYVGAQNAQNIPWAGLVRGLGRGVTGVHTQGETGFPDLEKNENLIALRGSISHLPKNIDVIVPIGGLGAGRNEARVEQFMEMVSADGGVHWRDLVREQSLLLTPDKENWVRTYWQVGNEINSHHFTQTLRAWAGLTPKQGPDDFDLIPYYVEYLLAPSVAGLRAAAFEITGTYETRIVLGTIANAYRPRSREWLDALLTYKVEGRFAPSLKGQKVSELVDIVAIHYLASQKKERWRAQLEDLHNTWRGKDRISGIWSTEEVGRRRANKGRAAATAMAVTSRYLSFVSKESLSPQQARFSMWGWQIGSAQFSAEGALSRLYDFFGTSAVLGQYDWPSETSGGESEWFLLKTLDQSRHVVVGVSLVQEAVTVKRVALPPDFLLPCPCVADVLSETGWQQVSLENVETDDEGRRWLKADVELTLGSTFALFLGEEQQPLSKGEGAL